MSLVIFHRHGQCLISLVIFHKQKSSFTRVNQEVERTRRIVEEPSRNHKKSLINNDEPLKNLEAMTGKLSDNVHKQKEEGNKSVGK